MKKYLLLIFVCSAAFAVEKSAPPQKEIAAKEPPKEITRENGPLTYRFDEPIPPINCTPERLTTIFLEPGETVQSQPVMGDTARWEYQLLIAGTGSQARTGLVLKPRRLDISTDVVVATDKRSYQFRVISQRLCMTRRFISPTPPRGTFPNIASNRQRSWLNDLRLLPRLL